MAPSLRQIVPTAPPTTTMFVFPIGTNSDPPSLQEGQKCLINNFHSCPHMFAILLLPWIGISCLFLPWPFVVRLLCWGKAKRAIVWNTLLLANATCFYVLGILMLLGSTWPQKIDRDAEIILAIIILASFIGICSTIRNFRRVLPELIHIKRYLAEISNQRTVSSWCQKADSDDLDPAVVYKILLSCRRDSRSQGGQSRTSMESTSAASGCSRRTRVLLRIGPSQRFSKRQEYRRLPATHFNPTASYSASLDVGYYDDDESSTPITERTSEGASEATS